MRFKKFRKTLHFYKVNFQLTAPYRVLFDVSFVQAVMQHKVEAERLMPKIFGAPVECGILSCARRVLGGKALPSLRVLPCAHPPTAQPDAHACLHAFLSAPERDEKDGRWAVAVQDEWALQELGAAFAGVPLVHLANTVVLMLAPPTRASLHFVHAREQARLGVDATLRPVVDAARAEAEAAEKAQKRAAGAHVGAALIHLQRERGKKGGKAKGANPLSMKKKKPRTLPAPQAPSEAGEKKKRRRRHGKRGREEGGEGEGEEKRGGEERPAKRARREEEEEEEDKSK